MGLLPASSNHMLDQVKTTTCSRNQHIAGRGGGVWIRIRMNINDDQIVSKAGLWTTTSLWPGSSLQDRQRSCHGTACSPAQFESWTVKCCMSCKRCICCKCCRDIEEVGCDQIRVENYGASWRPHGGMGRDSDRKEAERLLLL